MDNLSTNVVSADGVVQPTLLRLSERRILNVQLKCPVASAVFALLSIALSFNGFYGPFKLTTLQ
eukprot:1938330-Amphidinium_carterae.2